MPSSSTIHVLLGDGWVLHVPLGGVSGELLPEMPCVTWQVAACDRTLTARPPARMKPSSREKILARLPRKAADRG